VGKGFKVSGLKATCEARKNASKLQPRHRASTIGLKLEQPNMFLIS